MFCTVNRIRLSDPAAPKWGHQSPAPEQYHQRDRPSRPRDSEWDEGARGAKGKGGGGGDNWGPRSAPRPKPAAKPRSPPPADRQPPPTAKDAAAPKPRDRAAKPPAPKAPAKEAAAPAPAPTPAGAMAQPSVSLRDSVYWRYGPFPPTSRAATRNKLKIRLGTKGLHKLTALDGKKFEKHAPIFTTSLEVLSSILSFVSSLERWRLRGTASAFGLAFQLAPAWTAATLEPASSFQGPWILRDHLPIQLDVMQKHRATLTHLTITGFEGLQGALLQNYTALEVLKVFSSAGITGLGALPQTLRSLHLEFCTFKGDAAAQALTLAESRPTLEVTLVKCVDDQHLQGPAQGGPPLFINVHHKAAAAPAAAAAAPAP